SAIAQKAPASEADVKKQADKFFNNEKYVEATPLYSQLLSLYPQNSQYCYRYGVCLFFSGKEKVAAITYLEKAAKDVWVTKEVWFYLGRAYMYADHYSEAIECFTKLKTADIGLSIKLNAEQYITYCKNAGELKKMRRNIAVLKQQEVSRSAFYSLYDF